MIANQSESSVSIKQQLLSNQLWETIAFAAKACFVVGLTPWMLRVWGPKGYGEFALASSSFVLLAILDLGVRGRTRVALCRTRSTSDSDWPFIMGQALAAGGIVSLTATAIAAVFTVSGSLRNDIGLSISNPYLLLITTALAMAILLSGLLLEPLVAAQAIGRLKMATASGWLFAIMAVAVVLLSRGSVTVAIVAWLGCLLLANLVVALASDLPVGKFCRHGCMTKFRDIRALLREGFWLNVANATWLTKTYGITLVIFARDGAVTAGVFYILLRLSEIISALGAIAVDVLLGDLARSPNVTEQRQSFRSSYSWVLLLSLYGALVIGFFTTDFGRVWLHRAVPFSPFAGVVVAVLGLASALNRTATYAAMALGVVRTAAKWGAIETIGFISILLLVPRSLSLIGGLAVASLSACALLPIATKVSQRLGSSSSAIWLHPLVRVAPGVIAATLALTFASWSGNFALKLLAAAICAGLALAGVITWRDDSNSAVPNYFRARQAKFKQKAVLERA